MINDDKIAEEVLGERQWHTRGVGWKLKATSKGGHGSSSSIGWFPP